MPRGKNNDLTGRRFGWLVVLNRASAPGVHNIKWMVRCKCGTEKQVFGSALRSRKTTSCGCYRKMASAERAQAMSGAGLAYNRSEAAFAEVFGRRKPTPHVATPPARLEHAIVPDELCTVFAVTLPHGTPRPPHRCLDDDSAEAAA